ncbi:sigma-70 family RNA polymerase sigma factor [Sphingomonas morindae]|uniref:Sigma-70 family RNA polymerase sigma factor n=1 Tax=Sphingomonas morindae TaxID=1541170 RepID=A0ABY4X6L9_9SPHN|nr:sigma-70 family RNA polymerase sigma factor [Sphingomonas morindae]USI72569.1 sigma-70 family RNA polymerase sigma factor [Sphingomonas morindae]
MVRPSSDAEMIAGVRPLIPALRRYARALLRDGDEADDLVQDALERALRRWAQRQPGMSARGWLFAILHNLAIDRLRRRARQGVAEPLEAVPAARLVTPAGQEEALARADILRLLDRLPEEQRAALLLIGVEELSYGEAALVLGVPVGTVMSRLSRGRERLRRLAEGADTGRPALRIVR